ncbi:MAG: flagellar biosynthesis anti-sigma factor FlgM [Treponema sp.]|jgi:negative regulator of flagellin synthesis FlgM|nr:flagellar biosynthesis anti-sigma factor FlgM [Treponema sp.]
MTIDKIGSIDPIQPGKKPGQTSRIRETPKSDSISISPEAVEKAELYRAMEWAIAAPDVRAERVAELRAKIDDPSYLNDQIIDATADRLMDALFG